MRPLRFQDVSAKAQASLLAEDPTLIPPRGLSRSARAEDEFATQCRQYQLPPFMAKPKQCYFAKAHNGRLWRFDFAWPQFKVAVEIEGLVVRKLYERYEALDENNKTVIRYRDVLAVTGRHASVNGFREDCEKYNTAALLGWTVLRFEQKLVRPGDAMEVTIRMLSAKGWSGAGG